MPEFLTVVGDVRCQKCGHLIDSAVDIQWGKIPSRRRVGEHVNWLRVQGNIVRPFTLLEGQTSWNCGDPIIDTVFVFDSNRYAVDNKEVVRCENCAVEIAGVMVVIEKNVITKIVTCSHEEMVRFFGSKLGNADVIVVKNDKSLTVRDDWFDHVIGYGET